MTEASPSRRGVRRHHGLTLLEVIVAMTLLAVGIAGTLGAITACLRSCDASTQYSRGVLLAQQVAAELSRDEALEAGALFGTFDDASVGYTWNADVGVADAQGVLPVQITVSWQYGTRQYELYTQLRPRPLPPAAQLAPPTTSGGQETSPPSGAATPPSSGPTTPGPSTPSGPGQGSGPGRRVR